MKAIAILFFIVSVALAGLALKDGYSAWAEQSNTDTSRASHVITESGSYEYFYAVDQMKVDRLKSLVWSKAIYFGLTLAAAGILWGLAEISDRLGQKSKQ